MTISTLVLRIGIVAILLTIAIGFGWKKGSKNWMMMFLQYFTGVLFLFSGWVKAIDPLGTAYKMEQYFAEFELTFADTFLSFLAPIFPWLTSMSVGFSVFMIIFEMVLDLALILGHAPKWTSWLFFGLVAFFTVLTGFTFLTGYVPSGTNFFEFSSWGAYKESNMRVTDCGCFGDFIKLKPKISFFKDLVLLLPALYFLWRRDEMTQLFSGKTRQIALGLLTVGLFFYCLSNYFWNLPHTDFRPFKNGVNVAAVKDMEEQAAADVEVYAWVLKNKETGEIIELPTKTYFAGLSSDYSKDKFEVVEQLSTKPTIEPTKISEFAVSDTRGNDVSYEYFEGETANFMIVCHKLKGKANTQTITVQDTTWLIDTIVTVDNATPQIVKSVAGVNSREEKVVDYTWDEAYLEDFKQVIKPLAEAAIADGKKVSLVAGGADNNALSDLIQDTGLTGVETYKADDILLKTIVRSNPGIVLWKDGTILHKWHKKKLPTYDNIVKSHLK